MQDGEVMKKEMMTATIKLRCTPNEKRELELRAKQENVDMSKIIRDSVFPPKNKMRKNINGNSKPTQERLRQEKIILGTICNSLNQLKADVNKVDAVSKLEKEVESLCQLLR